MSTGFELLVILGTPNTATAPASEEEVLEVWQLEVSSRVRFGLVLCCETGPCFGYFPSSRPLTLDWMAFVTSYGFSDPWITVIPLFLQG